MGFEKFGGVSYLGETKVAEFIKFLEEGKICGTKCRKCGRLNFPPRAHCNDCYGSDYEWVQLSGECKLLTYTHVHFAPAAFREDAPYILAIAELKEGPKVFARVARGVKEEDLEIGMGMKLVPVKLPGGKVSYELVAP